MTWPIRELFSAMTDLEPPPTQLLQANRATEFLANQRTFLAWIRTSIAVISFGFVTGKLSVMLPFLAGRNDPTAETMSAVHKFPVGLGMIAFGGVLARYVTSRHDGTSLLRINFTLKMKPELFNS